ncbi:MAG: ParB/RepB/Spo0J family partition protein [Azospirillaceae bacterium]
MSDEDAGRDMPDDGARQTREDAPRRRHGLGRGLDALFGEDDGGYESGSDKARASRVVPTAHLAPNPYQPRRAFTDEELDSLAASVREQGILQPILVRPDPARDDRFQIIAGERRWRAAQRAKLHEVPIVVRELTDVDALHLAIIENVQRQDLTALEEANGYRRLIDEFGHSQDDLARAIGKSRSHIANTLRLLELPETVRDLLQSGKLSAGHGRALLACEDPDAAAREVVAKGLNVRQAEALARKGAEPRHRAPRGSASAGAEAATEGRSSPATGRKGKDPDTVALEQEMSNILGLKVVIESDGDHAGTLTVHYKTFEQLDDILQRLSHGGRQ